MSCIEFPRKMRFCADLHFLKESVCLSSDGQEFHIVSSAKEHEQCPNVFVHSFGIHRILLSEEEREYVLGV